MSALGKNKVVIWVLVIILVLLVVRALMASRSDNNVDDEPIKVGALLALSGPAAFFGEEIRNGMELANESIGLDIVYEDQENKPAKAASAFAKLRDQDNIDLILSTGSAITSVVLPLAEEAGMPALVTSVSSSKVAQSSELAFRYFTSGEQDAPIMATYGFEKLGHRTAAVLHLDDEYGLSHLWGFQNAFEGLGGSVVLVEPYLPGLSDFRSRLAKVKEANADILYFVGLSTDSIALLKQIRELEMDQTLMTNWALSQPAIEEAGENAEGIYLTVPGYYLDEKSEKTRQFIDQYVERYGKDPSAFAAIGYDVVHILELVKDKKDAAEIIEAFRGIRDFEAVMGELIVDPYGEITFPLYPAQVQGGVPVLVE